MKLINGGKYTIFKANLTPKSGRKKWILSKRNRLKYIIIDEGAQNALKSGKSLLSAGIINASNNFNRGETVNIISKSKKVLGCGIIAYDSTEIKIISGKPVGTGKEDFLPGHKRQFCKGAPSCLSLPVF